MTATLPKSALAILSLPGVESLHLEADGWCCYLHYGWTTDALGGGSTIIDPNLKTIRAFVTGAYEMEPPQDEPVAQSAPVLPGESAAPKLPSHGTAAPTLPRFTVETYRGCRDGWQPTVTRQDRAAADRLMALIGRIRPQCVHRIATL